MRVSNMTNLAAGRRGKLGYTSCAKLGLGGATETSLNLLYVEEIQRDHHVTG